MYMEELKETVKAMCIMITLHQTMYSLQAISKRARKVSSDFFKSQPTLTESKVAPIFREPGVIRGYRKPNQPWRYYIISLFQIHNETVNVWTHLIGGFVIWFTMAEYYEKLDFWTYKHSWVMLVFGICALISCSLSSGVHLLHSKSEECHYNAFMIDYIGVTLYAYGSGVKAFYISSDKDTYLATEKFYFPVLWVYSWLNYVVLCVAKVYFGSDISYRSYRKLIMVSSMTGHAILLTIPIVPRYVKCFQEEFCSLSSLNHLTILYTLFTLQAFFFASHFPEVLAPGTFDIVGQGHQIFHVLITLCQCAQFNSIYHEIDNGHASHSEPDPLHLAFSTFALILVQLFSFQIMRQFIKVDTVNKKLN